MNNTPFQPVQCAEIDWQDGTPVAPDFDDPYFSRDNGIAESSYVFAKANQLAERFTALRPGQSFTLGETGFGTGLNFFCACQCWLESAPETSRLHYISVEKFPLSYEDFNLARKQWPQFDQFSKELAEHWPAETPGFHHIQLQRGRIQLTLLYGDAAQMLAQLNQHRHKAVDSWFLDGFAPARNPAMWTPDLFQQLARLSHTDTRFSTFTAAGIVRRGLQEAGFYVEKQAGFGRKRHMLVGYWPDQHPDTSKPEYKIQEQPTTCGSLSASDATKHECEIQEPSSPPPSTLIIAGAGLAGCTMARAIAELGWQVILLDPAGIAQQASGNLAGIVFTSPSAHPTAQNRFYQSSFLHSLHWFRRYGFPQHSGQGAFTGIYQQCVNTKQQHKLEQAVRSGYWPETLLQQDHDRFLLPMAGFISPGQWCQHLIDHPAIRVITAAVTRVHPGTLPKVDYRTQETAGQLQGNAVVLCNTFSAPSLIQADWLSLKKIRGQVSYCRATEESEKWQQAFCHSGYLTPALHGVHCVGATFDLHNESALVQEQDNAINLQELETHLPDHWQALGGKNIDVAGQRVAFRCQSTDFLPISGEAVRRLENDTLETLPGIYLNIAHGSRGITGTPLCASLLAALIDKQSLPVDEQMRAALAPARFLLRKQAKRQKHPPSRNSQAAARS